MIACHRSGRVEDGESGVDSRAGGHDPHDRDVGSPNVTLNGIGGAAGRTEVTQGSEHPPGESLDDLRTRSVLFPKPGDLP